MNSKSSKSKTDPLGEVVKVLQDEKERLDEKYGLRFRIRLHQENSFPGGPENFIIEMCVGPLSARRIISTTSFRGSTDYARYAMGYTTRQLEEDLKIKALSSFSK